MNNEHEVGNLSKNGLIFNALDLSHFNLDNFAALRENGPVQTPPPKCGIFHTFFTGSHVLHLQHLGKMALRENGTHGFPCAALAALRENGP